MNILHIAPFYPSMNAIHAGGVCMGREIEELKRRNQVYSISFVQEKYDAELYREENRDKTFGIVIDEKDKVFNIILHPFTAPYFATRASSKIRKLIDMCIKKYDIEAIHAEYSSMAQYVSVKKKYPQIKFNVVLHDVTIQSYMRQLNNAKGIVKRIYLRWCLLLVKKNEKKWLSKADSIFVFTEKDRKLVKDIYGLTNTKRINTEFAVEKKSEKRKNYLRICDGYFGIAFMGQMNRAENIEAAERLINIYSNQLKNDSMIKIHIIGNNPPIRLMNKNNDNIIVTGFVDDVDKYLIENCDIAVFPLNIGAGIKLKVLHCMALGIPIVTNQIGAEGIDEEGRYIKLAESDHEFAEIIELLRNKADKKEVNNMINFVMSDFSWEYTKKAFEEIYH